MTEKINFTDQRIESLKAPIDPEITYRDSNEQGLIIRVRRTGNRVFYFYKKIQGRPRLIKLASFPDISVQEAREMVRTLKNQLAKGLPLSINEKPQNNSGIKFKELLDKYINDYAKYNNKSWQATKKSVDTNAKQLCCQQVQCITKQDILEIFNRMTTKGLYGANRFLDILNAIFNKGIEWELLDKNPAAGIKKHKEKSRDRYITLDEQEQFLEAVFVEKNQAVKDFVLLALYTGARKGNVLSMNWKSIDFGNLTWYIKDTKNGEPQNVVLTEEAIKILETRKENSDSPWVFPSPTSATGHFQEPRKGWERIVRRSGLKDIRIHDLRRTCGSWMAISGASQYIIGKQLGHKSPISTAIYARLSLDPVREYMEKSAKLTNGELQKKIEELKNKNAQ